MLLSIIRNSNFFFSSCSESKEILLLWHRAQICSFHLLMIWFFIGRAWIVVPPEQWTDHQWEMCLKASVNSGTCLCVLYNFAPVPIWKKKEAQYVEWLFNQHFHNSMKSGVVRGWKMCFPPYCHFQFEIPTLALQFGTFGKTYLGRASACLDLQKGLHCSSRYCIWLRLQSLFL